MKPVRFLILLCALTVIAIVSVAVYIRVITSTGLPSLEQLENPPQNQATRIFSSDGVLLDHFYVERRVSLPYDSIPKDFINALVATEDKEFWNHWGVHLGRVFNAFVKNVFGDREGASTITMQLARNLFLNQDFTLTRKIRETFVAIQIERHYTKQEIIGMYANTVNFGKGAYGINVASQVYFDKVPSELTTAQCAMLVGLLKAPEHYNPITYPDRAKYRRNTVLALMRGQNYLTAAQLDSASDEPIDVFRNDPKNPRTRKTLGSSSAHHFVEMVRQDLSKDNTLGDYDLYRDGLIIHTTLNSRIQQYANEAVKEHFEEFQKSFNKTWNWAYHKDLLKQIIQEAIEKTPQYRKADENKKKAIANQLRNNTSFVDSVKNAVTTVQCGVVVIDPTTGAILGMVGASPKFMREYSAAKYSLNHVTQIRRQPGSSFKPFVYTMSLEDGFTPSTMVECGPYSYTLPTGEVWSPRGTGHCASGEFRSLADALKYSINTVAARLITNVTNANEVITLARKMGVESPLHAVPALALGAGGEVEPLELTSAFGTFAFNGIHVPPYFIDKVEDKFGSVIESKAKSRNITEAIPPNINTQMTYMLEGVVNGGTAWSGVRKNFTGVDAAGKTGTTNDAADAWFVGFTPQLVAGVWVGFDDKRITFENMDAEGYGGKAAAPIWGKLMNKIYNDPVLPYKQKVFSYKKLIDSTDIKSSVPYSLSQKQLEMNPTEEAPRPRLPEPEPQKPALQPLNQMKKEN